MDWDKNKEDSAKRKKPTPRKNTDIEQIRKNSVDNRIIRSQKTKKEVTSAFKKNVIPVAISIFLGVAIGSNVANALDTYNDESNETVQTVTQIIKNNTHRAIDPNYYQYSVNTISDELESSIKQGSDPLIVLGTLGKKLDKDFEKDDLDQITTNVFGQDADTLVTNMNPERYDKGIHDTDFESDINDYIRLQNNLDPSGLYQNNNSKGRSVK